MKSTPCVKLAKGGAEGSCEKKNCDISELVLKIDPRHWPLFERCRRSAPLHSYRLNALGGPGDSEKCAWVSLLPRFLLYLYAFAREQFSMFGEQIKPLEPQDKSDSRKKAW